MAKLLVIDDEAPLTTLISRFFVGAGFEVEMATSGQEGLNRAMAGRPDAIVLDIMMPDLDGYEVCRRLRADPRTTRTVIVVLTARAQAVDRQAAIRAGADAHIVKPFEGKLLVRTVTDMLVAKPQATGPGRQVTVVRLKPAVGATTAAANLALALAEERARLAVAVDAGGGGALARVLGVAAEEANAAAWSSNETPGEWTAAHLARHPGGLFVLPALPAPGGGSMTQVLEVLGSWFDYVVVDTPLSLGALAPVVLSCSGLVLLMLPVEPNAARAAQVAAGAIVKYAGRAVPVWPVLTGTAPDLDAIRQQVEQALGAAAAVLPWAPEDCARAEASRQPVVWGQAASPLAAAIRSLAARIAALGAAA